jgi:single-stranded-DNA-specific exonuclease
LAARAASKLCRELEKPIFLYWKGKKESQGSVRLPSKFDALELMEPCAKFLINYGGHSQAAGFGLENKNLDKFKACLIKNIGLTALFSEI